MSGLSLRALARQIYRGNPVAADHQPDPEQIVDLFGKIDEAAKTTVNVVQTLSDLNAITPDSETEGGTVLSDGENSGFYYRDEDAWVKGRSLPDSLVSVTLGGTANAQTGTIGDGVDPSNIAAFFAEVTTDNLSDMTLALTGVNGSAALPVKNAAGNALSGGEWSGYVFFVDKTTFYQMINSPGAEAAAAASASDAAASAALTAESNGISGVQVEKTSDYTIVVGDVGKTIIHTSAGNHTFSFSAAGTLGVSFLMIVKNEGLGDLTLDPDGSETIDGSATIDLLTGQSALVMSDGTNLRSLFLGGGDTGSGLTVATAQDSTSGTSIDFTSIPEGANRVSISLAGVSLASGTTSAAIMIRTGDIDGLETSGYTGSAERAGVAGTGWATGMVVSQGMSSGSSVVYGVVTLERVDGNLWLTSGVTSRSDASNAHTIYSGSKELSGELTQIRVTTVGGTDVFSAGKINVISE